jgi:hypothetical protein
MVASLNCRFDKLHRFHWLTPFKVSCRDLGGANPVENTTIPERQLSIFVAKVPTCCVAGDSVLKAEHMTGPRKEWRLQYLDFARDVYTFAF